jgi:uncharacterized caspase-like protein
MAAAGQAVQIATGASKAPGARLHVLAIGVSDYGEKAKHLRLQFAHRDAYDVASALLNTQSGLYAEVLPQILENATANKASIMRAFAALRQNMAKGGGQDFAVVLFSGHGAVIDGSFYVLPHGIDASTPADLKASALPASEFQAEIRELAQHGRVLVLLDACRSGAVTADGAALPANADVLRSLIAQSNVTVLTSSSADKASREDHAWGHGAFTKVLLEAFGRAADANHDGVVSVSELTTDYLARQVPVLTGGQQKPGIEMRFQSDILVAGL